MSINLTRLTCDGASWSVANPANSSAVASSESVSNLLTSRLLPISMTLESLSPAAIAAGRVLPDVRSAWGRAALPSAIPASASATATSESGRGPAVEAERRILQTQLRELNGEASNGTIHAAWEKFEESKRLLPSEIPSFETMNSSVAAKHLSDLQSRFYEIEKELSVKRPLLSCLRNPSESIPDLVLGYLDETLLSSKRELEELCGKKCNGTIHSAWQAYESSGKASETYEKYRSLDQRRIQLEEVIPILNSLISQGKAIGVDCFPLQRMLALDLEVEQLQSERLRLTGPSGFNGEIDKAHKVLTAISHRETYESLDSRKKQLETKLAALAAPIPSASTSSVISASAATTSPASAPVASVIDTATALNIAKLEDKINSLKELIKNLTSAAALNHQTKSFLESHKKQYMIYLEELTGGEKYDGILYKKFNEYNSRLEANGTLSEIEDALKQYQTLHTEYSEIKNRIDLVEVLLDEDKRKEVAKDSRLGKAFTEFISKLEEKAAKYATQLAELKASGASEPGRIAALFGLASPAAGGAGAASTTLAGLLASYDAAWNESIKDFSPMEFDVAAFKARAKEYVERFPLSYDPEKDFGYIEKRIVDPATKIFVRADLHGDLKSLLENLKTLRSQGLLDENFNCRPGVHLMFLGDYMDRGAYSTQILDLLMRLRMQNPQAVTLIRGNHESISSTKFSNGADKVFKRISEQADYTEYCTLFEGVYRTFPLASFIGEKTLDGSVQYTMFTHGLFELYADPNPMLVDGKTSSTMPIQGQISNTCNIHLFSERVKSLAAADPARLAADLAAIEDQIKSAPASEALAELKFRKQSIKQQLASLRIHELASTERRPYYRLLLGADYSFKKLNVEITTFNWGDIGEVYYTDSQTDSQMGDPGARKWILKPDDVKEYFRLISSDRMIRTVDGSVVPAVKVKMLFRGHQHLFQHAITSKGKCVATTLPVGMDSPYKNNARFKGQQDIAYILTTSDKVKKWNKQALLRDSGASVTMMCPAIPIGSH